MKSELKSYKMKTDNKKEIQSKKLLNVDSKMSRKTVTVVFFSLLIDLFAFTMILPLLPTLMDYYQKHDTSGLYPYLVDKIKYFQQLFDVPEHFNAVLFGGFIGSLFSFLQFLASPVVGALSDVYGRKPALLLSMLGELLAYALWAASHNFSLFVIARIVGGISKSNVNLSTAIIADVTSHETRGRGMAMIGAAFSLGFILGPISGVLFAQWARADAVFVMPALLAFSLVFVDIVYLAMCFMESLPKDKRAKNFETGISNALNYINPFSLFAFRPVEKLDSEGKKTLRRIGLVYFLYLFLYSGMEFTLTFLTHLRFHYTRMQQGKMFLFIGIIMAAIQGGYVRRIRAENLQKAVLQGIFLIIPSFVIIGFATTPSMMYLGLALYSYASAIVVPCLTTMASTYGSVTQKGTVMGIFRSLGALARASGPIVASCAFWSFGAAACYVTGAVFLLVPWVLFYKLKLGKKD